MRHRTTSGAVLRSLLLTVPFFLGASPDFAAGQAEPRGAGIPLRDLRAVLDTGVVLQDRNGDHVVDFVDGRILLSTYPREAEIVVAANLAARLGYETSGLNLGLAEGVDGRQRSSAPVFLVGAGVVDGAGLADDSDPLRGGLAPGQGILAHFPGMGDLQGGAVALAGYDATGLLEAGSYLSGRYPEVWGPDGTMWREVAEKLESFVHGEFLGIGSGDEVGGGGVEGVEGAAAGGVAQAVEVTAAVAEVEGTGEKGAEEGEVQEALSALGVSVHLDRIVVDANRTGVARARVTVRVNEDSEYQLLVDAFLGRDTLVAGGEGEEGEGPGDEDVVAPSDEEVSAVGGVEATEEDEEDPEAGRVEKAPTLADLEFKDLHRLDVRLVGPEGFRTFTLRPEEPWTTGADGDFRRASDSPFSLPTLYSVGGLFRDTNRDLVPDETNAVLLLSGTAGAFSVVDLASRIGLETAGLRFPLARVAGQENDPAEEGFPVLIGTDHYQIHRLREEEKLPSTDVGAGQGFIQLVDEAFGERNALVVGGADADGLTAAVDWLARRAPYLWTHGKGEFRLADAETQIRRFFQAREAPGQVALALFKLDAWMDRLAAEAPSRVEVELAALEAPEGLEDLMAERVRTRFPEAEVDVATWPTGFGVGDTIFAHDWEIPWEVDDVRRILAQEVYPNLQRGQPAEIEVRVSESPELRATLEAEIQAELGNRGASGSTVRVLSAYKQGYSWIHDVLLPDLRDLDVASIQLTYHTLEESEEVRWQTIAAETRWLQEVFPIDAVLARELGIPDSAVTFSPTREKDPIYTFEAVDRSGEVLLRETFTPKYVVRPFFDLFPEYEQVRVTTGWVRASSGGTTLVDRRVATDPERFWDRLQTEAYGEMIQYVMDIQDGDPSAANAPFFDVFQVDLRLSEPNYRIGIDEEGISSLEALHEDIFFETHTLFSLIGGRYQSSLPYPGRVLPFMDPSGEGEPGRARVTFTGKERGNPELILRTWTGDTQAPKVQRYELDPLPVEAPRLVGAIFTAGEEGVQQLLTRLVVTDSVDRFQEFEGRSSEGAIDRQFLSSELVEGLLSSLGDLQTAGLFTETLAWDRVGELALDIRLEKDSTYQRTAILSGNGAPGSTDNPRLTADGWSYSGQPLVQWDTPIPPEENVEVLARLATFPGVSAYYLTDSYLGNRVWAADFLPPQEAEFISQAKLNALKPTLFISGREHANEVSSTSHILRLGELLVTDSAYKELLKDVNVVLHPMTNTDGAALVHERLLVNPNHMLHAGRPGALGVDATSGGRSADPMYPEARARHLINEAWLPDVYLNPHGYPSHEWVQYFAGYSAWVRSRSGGARDWWVPRSWFIPGLSWVDDEENPDFKTAQFAILDTMAAAMTSAEELDGVNRRLYARYKKYGVQDREGFTEYFHNGMLVNMRLRGAESIGNGLYSPRITYFSATTEAPDEPAFGDWMRLMGRMGLTHTSSVLRYLATGEFETEREAEAFKGVVTRKVFRLKPVVPEGTGAKKEKEGGAGPARRGSGR